MRISPMHHVASLKADILGYAPRNGGVKFNVLVARIRRDALKTGTPDFNRIGTTDLPRTGATAAAPRISTGPARH